MDGLEVPLDWHHYTLDRLHDGDPLHAVLVYEDSTVVVGFVTGEIQTWDWTAEMYALAVSGGHRRSGIGSALLEAFERFAREREAPSVDIGVPFGDNAGGRAFFDRRGYEVGLDLAGVNRATLMAGTPEVRYRRLLEGT